MFDEKQKKTQLCVSLSCGGVYIFSRKEDKDRAWNDVIPTLIENFLKTSGAMEVILFNGSNTQDLTMDLVARGCDQSKSVFVQMHLLYKWLTRYFKENVKDKNIKVACDQFLMLDDPDEIGKNWKLIQQYLLAEEKLLKHQQLKSFVTDRIQKIREGNKIQTSDNALCKRLKKRAFIDTSKLLLIYAQMHRASTQSDDNLAFVFIGGDRDAPESLSTFFSNNQDLMPDNVRLVCCSYSHLRENQNRQHKVGDEIMTPIQGEGKTNFNYLETIQTIFRSSLSRFVIRNLKEKKFDNVHDKEEGLFSWFKQAKNRSFSIGIAEELEKDKKFLDHFKRCHDRGVGKSVNKEKDNEEISKISDSNFNMMDFIKKLLPPEQFKQYQAFQPESNSTMFQPDADNTSPMTLKCTII